MSATLQREHWNGQPTHVGDLFRVACRRDLEGIVAKWVGGTYRADGRATSWLKITNRDYTQMVDRHELFADRHRHEGRASARVSRVDLVLS